jgi:hypothetical protein
LKHLHPCTRVAAPESMRARDQKTWRGAPEKRRHHDVIGL